MLTKNYGVGIVPIDQIVTQSSVSIMTWVKFELKVPVDTPCLGKFEVINTTGHFHLFPYEAPFTVTNFNLLRGFGG